MEKRLYLILLLSFSPALAGFSQLSDLHPLSSKVSIRLLTELKPESLIFSVLSGRYEIECGSGSIIKLLPGENIILARYDGKIAIKTRGASGFVADTLLLRGLTGDDIFTLRTHDGNKVSRKYSGDLLCFPDMGTMFLINDCDIEKYVAGVVKAEGGNGKNEEYFKTQAVIARTYIYKYYNKHNIDRYNLCDGTHCQAFNGITTDSLIIQAVTHTKDLVIIAPDSSLIMSAFHSNCGGETSPSEYVWLTSLPYLKKVIDPYCLNSRNAIWSKMISLAEWTGLLQRNGYRADSQDPSAYNFEQVSRVPDYITGSFSLPFRIIRLEMDLRSAYFSVAVKGDSVLLSGRGYGHGVGLCQEGAMEMSMREFTFKNIISFYYPGVNIIRIQDARKTEDEK
jgi:stage II sporulation protein D